MAKLLERLRNKAEERGRDPASIEINTMFGVQMMDPVNGVEQMKALGVDRIMVPAFFFAGPDGLDKLAEFGENVIPLANA